MTTVVQLPSINERYDQIATLLTVSYGGDYHIENVAGEVLKRYVPVYELESVFPTLEELAALEPTALRVEASVQRYKSGWAKHKGGVKGNVYVHFIARPSPGYGHRDELKNVIRQHLAKELGIEPRRVKIPTEAFADAS